MTCVIRDNRKFDRSLMERTEAEEPEASVEEQLADARKSLAHLEQVVEESDGILTEIEQLTGSPIHVVLQNLRHARGLYKVE